METFDPTELPELLKLYYRRLFPYSQYYRWLNYGGGDGGGEWGQEQINDHVKRGQCARLCAAGLLMLSRARPTTS
ncbi:hypothetical protein P7K49_019662 [Saguinus oedipus]|uniref:Uncharacterized protein n=1 Tax=Saguinus oedipus TaxID=9490 RepID=A0ABQ9UYR6_SAGOE|nr:hypothetical protein P7K49_019662 [Saguinus oedipus]